jgi:RNA polymerase sigma-70 factor (ECF subfamily)
MSGRKSLFLSLLEPNMRWLKATARQYMAGERDAEDLVQETALRAWRAFSPSDGRTFTRSWLLVIMRNLAIEWQRLARRRVRFVLVTEQELTEARADSVNEPFAALPSMEESPFREFLDERVAGALDELEPPYREVIILSVVGGLNYREIATAMGCPLGTVMSRMSRARRALRERLADYARSRGEVRESTR